MKRPALPRKFASGSAAVEFITLVPFILVLAATLWNVRSFILQRTELMRETFVVAEAIGGEATGTVPLEDALTALQTRLQRGQTRGSLTAAVVVRGTVDRPSSTSDCAGTGWCPPRVLHRSPLVGGTEWWPTGETDAGDCAGNSNLPAVNGHFAADRAVLPNEANTGATEGDWASRRLDNETWWVVVDACFDPSPGIIVEAFGQLTRGTLDIALVLRQRAVWGSVHVLADCDWC